MGFSGLAKFVERIDDLVPMTLLLIVPSPRTTYMLFNSSMRLVLGSVSQFRYLVMVRLYSSKTTFASLRATPRSPMQIATPKPGLSERPVALRRTENSLASLNEVQGSS